jgi:hypothetical protein
MSWPPHFGQLRLVTDDDSVFAVIDITSREIEVSYSIAYSIFPDLSAIDMSQQSTLR